MLNLILKNMLRTVVCCTCLYASGSPAQAQLSYHLGGRLFVDGNWYTHAGQEFNSGVGITDVRLCGKAGWVLRGRTLAYDMDDALQVCAPGEHSVLVFGRFNCTDLNSNALTGGKMYDVSAGMNYYPFKYLILRVNYSHQWTDTYCAIGKQQWGMLQTRVQVKF